MKDIKHLISDLEPSSTNECEDEHDDINSDVDSNDKTGSDLNEDLEHTGVKKLILKKFLMTTVFPIQV